MSTDSDCSNLLQLKGPFRVTESTEVKMSIFEHALAMDSREHMLNKGMEDVQNLLRKR